jgi:hypothetical protein
MHRLTAGQSALKAVQPMLVKAGRPAEIVEEWGRKADLGIAASSFPSHLPRPLLPSTELDGSLEPLWTRFRLAWGRKREGPGLPAPDLDISPLTEVSVPYPNYYEYDSTEHSQRQAAIRNRNKDTPPPPLPLLQPES